MKCLRAGGRICKVLGAGVVRHQGGEQQVDLEAAKAGARLDCRLGWCCSLWRVRARIRAEEASAVVCSFFC